MKTLIVGTGIIGVLYGWALSEADVDVTHLVRKGRVEKYLDGVPLDVLDERKGHPKNCLASYALKCVDHIATSDGYDLIVVPTNANQTEEALKILAPAAGGALFLIFSGNWEGTEFIDHLLPRDRYVLGYADGGGTIRDGVYWTNLGFEVHLGLPTGGSLEALETVKGLFAQAEIRADVQEDMVHWLWVHVAGVVGFAAGFARDRDVSLYLKDKQLLQECILSTRELYQLCRLRGVDVKKYPEVGMLNLPVWLVAGLFRWNFNHNEVMQRFTAHAASQSSLLETKSYFTGMTKTAQELDYHMPHTESLGAFLN